VGLNYAAHAAEGGAAVPPEPVLFLKAITSLSGPNDPVVRPKGATALDYEVELVIVIGKLARYVSEANAGQYIAGYAVGNDVSERDFQVKRSGQWTKGKSADTFAPFGPYLVTADGVAQNQLNLSLKVNGQQRQRSNVSDMIFKPHFLVSYISQFMSLEPGDLIYTGTPEGVALGMKPPAYLQPGDVMTLTIDGLGEQTQKVIAWEQSNLANVEDQLNALEQRRILALNSRDTTALQSILSDDYVHVHSTGHVDDRAGFIKGVQDRPRKSTRGPLTVRTYGDLAVVNGEQMNQAISPDGTAGPVVRHIATQVAHRDQTGWRFVSMHVTPIGELPGNVEKSVAYPPQSRRLTSEQKQVIALETRRAAAIANKDFKALADVLADDYLHVYGRGNTSDRAGYIEQVTAGPRVPTRGPLTVRVYGDSAVLTGDLLNRIKYPDKPEMVLDTFVTQVAHRVNGEWKFVSFQITPKRSN
jgi:5-carboxymethyl-2-hydroxymuconate isomerase